MNQDVQCTAGDGNSTDDNLLPGPNTYTLERVQRQLQLDTYAQNIKSRQYTPWPMKCSGLEYVLENGTHRFFSKEKQSTLREDFCRRLYHGLTDSKGHCSRLDDVYSQFVTCSFCYDDPGKIAYEAHKLLGRLPATPLALPDSSRFFDAVSSGEGETNRPRSWPAKWEELPVALYVTTNVVRAAFMVAMHGGKTVHTSLREYINTTANLLSTASELSAAATSGDERKKWFVVRAFLWTSWQRSSMLFLHCIIGAYMQIGYDDNSTEAYVLSGFSPTPGMSIQKMSMRCASQTKSSYMCGWAFELLRAHPCAVGLDFRRFHRRFSAAFDGLRARCTLDHQACMGDEPSSCRRFRGMTIKNQSMHNSDCSGNCEKLVWDETSYRSVNGAKAVKLVDAPQGRLTYCQASDQTLAISHVWSHGQGGRPEVGHGLNECLHQRYVSLAKALECNSYWMDTPCIPEDHELRREAILNINKIFENSKVTLVCDRDLMRIDAAELTLAVRETIVVTAMVCDWNLRAWTFLEAFRGRRNIHVLCQNNTAVSLKETVEVVCSEGSLDIALFLLSIPHLLPSRVRRGMKDTKGSPTVSGFMGLGTAGSLLSHREASRPGDDVVIWSLLLDDKVYNNAEAFWRSREGLTIPFHFLVSSAPRLKVPGWRWAPASPTAQLVENKSDGSKFRLLALDGSDSDAGLVTKDGLSATLLMYDFAGGLPGSKTLSCLIGTDLEPVDDRCQKNLQIIRRRYLRGFLWGALFRPIKSTTLYEPVVHRSDASKTFIIVCATNNRFRCVGQKDDRIFWTWRGVYQWDVREPLPEFIFMKDVYIV